jgi:hypothetical protein
MTMSMTKVKALDEAISHYEWEMDIANRISTEELLWYKSIHKELVALRDELIIKEIEDEFK